MSNCRVLWTWKRRWRDVKQFHFMFITASLEYGANMLYLMTSRNVIPNVLYRHNPFSLSLLFCQVNWLSIYVIPLSVHPQSILASENIGPTNRRNVVYKRKNDEYIGFVHVWFCFDLTFAMDLSCFEYSMMCTKFEERTNFTTVNRYASEKNAVEMHKMSNKIREINRHDNITALHFDQLNHIFNFSFRNKHTLSCILTIS